MANKGRKINWTKIFTVTIVLMISIGMIGSSFLFLF